MTVRLLAAWCALALFVPFAAHLLVIHWCLFSWHYPYALIPPGPAARAELDNFLRDSAATLTAAALILALTKNTGAPLLALVVTLCWVSAHHAQCVAVTSLGAPVHDAGPAAGARMQPRS